MRNTIGFREVSQLLPFSILWRYYMLSCMQVTSVSTFVPLSLLLFSPRGTSAGCYIRIYILCRLYYVFVTHSRVNSNKVWEINPSATFPLIIWLAFQAKFHWKLYWPGSAHNPRSFWEVWSPPYINDLEFYDRCAFGMFDLCGGSIVFHFSKSHCSFFIICIYYFSVSFFIMWVKTHHGCCGYVDIHTMHESMTGH